MGIVSVYQSPEAEAALKRQRRAATASSVIIAVLTVTLLGIILALILLPGLTTKSTSLVTYTATLEEEDPTDRPETNTQVQRQPSAPSSAMAKVIATNSVSPTAVPIPETIPEPSLDFGSGDDFGDGWGNGDGLGAGGTTFFGQSVRAERIAYVIDFSSSMGSGGRHELMRKELTKSLGQVSHGTNYSIIFFSCIAWEAGDDVDLDRNGGRATVKGDGGKRFQWKDAGGAKGWEPVGRPQRADWMTASKEQIAKSKKVVQSAPLSSGTAWNQGLEMALEMTPPPQVIYFMTDGVASGARKWAEEFGTKAAAKGVRINCIALMEPRAHDDMHELAKRSEGQFTIVSKDGKHKKVR